MLEGRNAGEKKFIHEYTRTLLIQWADHQIRFGSVPKRTGSASDKSVQVYLDYAISKGWVSKDGTQVNSSGFASAAGRLK